ncbi:MAG: hypothetical protein WC241_01545 [Candidatus Paceibacterota bacterium]|jgi:hypothetical protein
MNKLKEHQKKILKRIAVVVLVSLCFFSLVSFITIFKQYSKSGQLGIEYKINGKPTPRYHPVNINSIKPWMTFNYLNVVFKLPPDYLKNTLNITDIRYPNISINTYIKHHNLPPQIFLYDIEKAITNYLYKK